jgi:hypothetical protein
MTHHTIPLLSPAWCLGLVSSLLIVAAACWLFCATAVRHRNFVATALGCVLLGEIALTHIYLAAIQGTWTLSHGARLTNL